MIEVVKFRITGLSPLMQSNSACFITDEPDTALKLKQTEYDPEREAALRCYPKNGWSIPGPRHEGGSVAARSRGPGMLGGLSARADRRGGRGVTNKGGAARYATPHKPNQKEDRNMIEVVKFRITGLSPLMQSNSACFITDEPDTALKLKQTEYDPEREAKFHYLYQRSSDSQTQPSRHE